MKISSLKKVTCFRFHLRFLFSDIRSPPKGVKLVENILKPGWNWILIVMIDLLWNGEALKNHKPLTRWQLRYKICIFLLSKWLIIFLLPSAKHRGQAWIKLNKQGFMGFFSNSRVYFLTSTRSWTNRSVPLMRNFTKIIHQVVEGLRRP